ncbi:MAG: hypothetical protein WCS70_15575 [Verrucomicrobiota bacterium]
MDHLRAWQRDGIKKIAILEGIPPDMPAVNLPPLVEKAELAYDVIPTTEDDFRAIVARLRKHPTTGVLLCDETLACQLSYRQPDVIAALLGQNRVLMRTLFNADPRRFQQRLVDMVHFNWDRLAIRIADDLATGSYRDLEEPAILPAVLHLRAAASRFALPY